MARTHYIFVDYENVSEIDFDLLEDRPVKLVLILGARNKGVPVEMLQKSVKYASQVQIVKTEGEGKNALDFVLCYEIGKLAATSSDVTFHILSRDKGFDSLLKHLKKIEGKQIHRHEVFAEISILKRPERLPFAERVKCVIAFLAANKFSRASKEVGLISQIHALFGRRLKDKDVRAIYEDLVKRKVVRVNEMGRIDYADCAAV